MPNRPDATWRLGCVASHLAAAAGAEPEQELPPSSSGFLVSSLLEPPAASTVPASGALTELQLAEASNTSN